jgi:hypothetical protein
MSSSLKWVIAIVFVAGVVVTVGKLQSASFKKDKTNATMTANLQEFKASEMAQASALISCRSKVDKLLIQLKEGGEGPWGSIILLDENYLSDRQMCVALVARIGEDLNPLYEYREEIIYDASSEAPLALHRRVISCQAGNTECISHQSEALTSGFTFTGLTDAGPKVFSSLLKKFGIQADIPEVTLEQ